MSTAMTAVSRRQHEDVPLKERVPGSVQGAPVSLGAIRAARCSPRVLCERKSTSLPGTASAHKLSRCGSFQATPRRGRADVTDAVVGANETQLRTLAQDLLSEFGPRLKSHGADLAVSGGNLGGLFPLTRTAFGVELDLSWLPPYAFTPQRIHREIIAHTRSPLFRRVREVRSTNEVDNAVRKQIDQWLTERPWTRKKAPRGGRPRLRWRDADVTSGCTSIPPSCGSIFTVLAVTAAVRLGTLVVKRLPRRRMGS
jgi:hypothetical protein